jgi:ATP phosphoribosyltransferase
MPARARSQGGGQRGQRHRNSLEDGNLVRVGGEGKVETVIEERQVKALIPKLREAGAQDIIEYPLNKVIY